MRRWTQEIKDTVGMTVHDAGGLTISRVIWTGHDKSDVSQGPCYVMMVIMILCIFLYD